MSDLDLSNLAKPDAKPGLIVLVTGEHGAGKTTFGATMPAPVFANLEEGESSLAGRDGVRLLPRVDNADQLGRQLAALRTENHHFETLVVDSVTALIGLFEESILDVDRGQGKKTETINQALGGFGAGIRALENRAERFCRFCLDLRRERGMHVVWIGHSIVETITPPDGASFDRYGLAGHNRATAKFVQYADVVGICRQKSTLVEQAGEGRKIAHAVGYREFVCTPMPAAITKNRMGITESLRFEPEPPNPLDPWLAKKGVWK